MKETKLYVLDTTVLIEDPDVMYKLGDSIVVVPTAVIKELDGLKRSESEDVSKAARKVARTLDRLGSHGDLTAGVKLPTGGILRVTSNHEMINDLASDADNRIVGTAILIQKHEGKKVELLTTDTNMRTISRVHGVKAEFYPFGVDYGILKQTHSSLPAVKETVSRDKIHLFVALVVITMFFLILSLVDRSIEKWMIIINEKPSQLAGPLLFLFCLYIIAILNYIASIRGWKTYKKSRRYNFHKHEDIGTDTTASGLISNIFHKE